VSTHLRGAFLQRADDGYEHVLVRGLEEAGQERDGAGLPHRLLVLLALAAAPERHSAAARYLHVLVCVGC